MSVQLAPEPTVPVSPADSCHYVCNLDTTRTLCGFRNDAELDDGDEPTGCIVCDELALIATCPVCGTDCAWP